VWTSGKALHLCRPVDAEALASVSVGRRISGVTRHGKSIVIELEDGGCLCVHLGMSGRLRVQPFSDPALPHTHVRWTLDDTSSLRFIDPRRFGQVKAATRFEELTDLARLGPDPLTNLDAQSLKRILAASRAPLKSTLLDQKKIAGLGNIYVCEAMFLAGLHPSRPSDSCVRRAPRLFEAIVRVLNQSLERGGTTLRDYVDGTGNQGANQYGLHVYGREGAPCHVCGLTIRRMTQAGRSTFYCPRCQRPYTRAHE
jgi:formamidopyrimidine-DNA glycosylase